MRIAIYVRVSTNDQTVENQILRLTEYAQSKNGTTRFILR